MKKDPVLEWLKNEPCICGSTNWKREGKLKIYCETCGFVVFKGFPPGASDLL